MEKKYDPANVLLKLLYYCNKKKEVYFKRSDVTEYLVSSGVFSIPNKQGFDGNLSYFGYDIKNDTDGKRILLLRGKKINEKCLSGEMNIENHRTYIKVIDDDPEVFDEIDRLIENKTNEASAFVVRKSIVQKYSLEEVAERLFGNKKLYKKNEIYYTFPDIVRDCISRKILYELVNTEKLEAYDVQLIFPLYNDSELYYGEKVIGYNEIGELNNDFCYFEYRLTDAMFAEYEIQEISNEKIIRLINKLEYNLSGKDTTRKILNNIRLNTSALRALAINRDRYKCSLCNIKNTKMLICSHIKPWRTGDGRLDLDNVLTLCVLHDALFDKGFITFDQAGNLLKSTDEVMNDSSILAFLNEGSSRLSLDISDKMKHYLKYHQEKVFKR